MIINILILSVCRSSLYVYVYIRQIRTYKDGPHIERVNMHHLFRGYVVKGRLLCMSIQTCKYLYPSIHRQIFIEKNCEGLLDVNPCPAMPGYMF